MGWIGHIVLGRRQSWTQSAGLFLLSSAQYTWSNRLTFILFFFSDLFSSGTTVLLANDWAFSSSHPNRTYTRGIKDSDLGGFWFLVFFCVVLQMVKKCVSVQEISKPLKGIVMNITKSFTIPAIKAVITEVSEQRRGDCWGAKSDTFIMIHWALTFFRNTAICKRHLYAHSIFTQMETFNQMLDVVVNFLQARKMRGGPDVTKRVTVSPVGFSFFFWVASSDSVTSGRVRGLWGELCATSLRPSLLIHVSVSCLWMPPLAIKCGC